ncbi:ABC transporter ATP-binding protein [Phytoactinopolyspora alkaliphila]|uniref:ABC transporter ATP-binding protein n=1 Tax=Phytoactinopolyspora alkaliphila TaxID=1783498 RepID=A0A6N9YT35_9ACTN|nr:ABC transporter ATP-binding protein [Phytoactinopolyspora alkaliphila]
MQVSLGERQLLAPTDLTVEAGESVAVLGPSGSGKTTFLACLAGLRAPTSGSVRLLDHELTTLSSTQRARVRLDSIGFVFQHADLLPELSPVENIMLPGLLKGGDPDGVRAEADWLIEDLGVRTTAETAHLSGGEAQRLALARALITQPSLLLADEPTGALDRATRDEVLEVMFAKIRSEQMGAVIVTHDEEVAAAADRTIELAAVRPAEAT